MEERGQVLEVDLPQVPRQDSARSTPALEHSKEQTWVGFFLQVDRQQLNLSMPVPTWEKVWSREAGFNARRIGD
jgi:hypothetical protein